MEIRSSNSLLCVDEDDNPIGINEKLEVHRLGLLHRAFSIFIFKIEDISIKYLLMQRRGLSKYHTPGLWTNTCCGHASPLDDIAVSAKKRLKEEMGFTCNINSVGKFTYKSILDNNLIE